MKYTSIFVLLFILTSLISGDKYERPIQFTKPQIFYTHVENTFEIYIPEKKLNTVTVNSVKTLPKMDSSLKKGKGFIKYFLNYDHPGNDTIRVFIGDQILYYFIAEVKELPIPEIYIGGHFRSGDIRYFDLRNENGIIPVTDALIKVKYLTVSFRFTWINHEGIKTRFTCEGPLFNDKALDIIQNKVSIGDLIVIDKCYIKGPDGVSKETKAIVYNIV